MNHSSQTDLTQVTKPSTNAQPSGYSYSDRLVALSAALLLLSSRDVQRRRKRRKTKHFEDLKNRRLTKGIARSKHDHVWPAYEIDELNAAEIAGKSDDEIRALVEELETLRPRLFVQLQAARRALLENAA